MQIIIGAIYRDRDGKQQYMKIPYERIGEFRSKDYVMYLNSYVVVTATVSVDVKVIWKMLEGIPRFVLANQWRYSL